MFVFVYGTLTEPERVSSVLETTRSTAADAFVGPATLEGLHRVDGRYPTLAPGGSVDGRLLTVDETALARLDRYEGVDRGLYVRIEVPAATEITGEPCWIYVGDPDELEVDVTWPGDGQLRDRVRRFVSQDVTVGQTLE
ncbi:gamma-glutamylcyclotransferase family protein [Natrinema salinisoli]|uniref:gamma-glutamylcyclotransferase family protein n=1 Tax=Natrinema salinisoli TaxID=2878535 RepID=UPI001CF0C043|nr:gamma-glutamylcyclotransferase family protein [Natrinema salinisoli]